MIRNAHPADTLAHIRAQIASLEERERRLRAYLLEHPEDREGANFVASVVSSVVRLWRRRPVDPDREVRDVSFGRWLRGCCDVDCATYKAATSAALWASWVDYAKAANHEPGSRKVFARMLELHGFKALRLGHERTRAWSGLCLRPASSDTPWVSWPAHSDSDGDARRMP